MSHLDVFKNLRQQSLNLCEALATEDYCAQAAPFVSPPKWHLAHTTWFFDRFILRQFENQYREYNPIFNQLFNSYYKSQGHHWPQSQRGILSRPLVSEVLQYHNNITQRIDDLLSQPQTSSKALELLTLGINHEQQHQELLIMDTKYNFFTHPFEVKIKGPFPMGTQLGRLQNIKLDKMNFCEGTSWVGQDFHADQFCFDNETPRHKTYLNPFAISLNLVTNNEYLEFIDDKGYSTFEHWLSAGWDWLNLNKISAPLYWKFMDNEWMEYDFDGYQPLRLDAPVKHLSYFEAHAYCQWKKAELPTEAQWEALAKAQSSYNKDENNSQARPQSSLPINYERSLFDCLWQWTNSAYLPHPGYQRPIGAYGEYNFKFMNNQMILKGGCYATPKNHSRPSYRNFFQPHDRWAFTGLRLAWSPS